MKWTLFLAPSVPFLFLLGACAPQPNLNVPPEYQEGQQYFHKVCSECHGSDALGKQTKAPGLIDAEYLPDSYSDDDFRSQIIDGSDKMPSQKNRVTSREINEIIKYLRYSQEVAELTSDDEEPEEDDTFVDAEEFKSKDSGGSS